MAMWEIIEVATFKDWMSIFFFVFFWPILFGILHFMVIGKHPFSNPINDWRILKEFAAEVARAEPIVREKKPRRVIITPDDYWDGEVNYETGEVGADTGPAIRYPKNPDRAYQGST